MYKMILVPLDLSDSDGPILEHVIDLAQHCDAKVALLHVADGFAARYQEVLNLADSEEIHGDREYLIRRRTELQDAGLKVEAYLTGGEPARKIVELAAELNCDLIAMGTHGHRGLADLVLGSVAEGVRHATTIPVLLLRTKRK
jgi:nucleotide-binding universal stress UspA family protein